jgi:hypothetical protein
VDEVLLFHERARLDLGLFSQACCLVIKGGDVSDTPKQYKKLGQMAVNREGHNGNLAPILFTSVIAQSVDWSLGVTRPCPDGLRFGQGHTLWRQSLWATTGMGSDQSDKLQTTTKIF